VNKTTQTVESAAAGGRYPAVWGGIRLRIDPVRDPAPLFRRLV
jgi:starch synthase (maltosyl-transferring)